MPSVCPLRLCANFRTDAGMTSRTELSTTPSQTRQFPAPIAVAARRQANCLFVLLNAHVTGRVENGLGMVGEQSDAESAARQYFCEEPENCNEEVEHGNKEGVSACCDGHRGKSQIADTNLPSKASHAQRQGRGFVTV